MSWTESDIPDQTGRVALITGGNSGLGLVTSRALATKGATVIMAARNQEKAAEAKEQILTRVPDAGIDVRPLDLGSLDSIKNFAGSVRSDYDMIDLLINNAGVMAVPERKTADGFEMQFGTNHLGHYALTARLLPLLVDTAGSRVVTVTSGARHFARPVDPANPHMEGNYDKWRAYGQSKLANVHFAIGLEQRFRESGAHTMSLLAHPGSAKTDLQANTAREGGGDTALRAVQRVGMSPDRGALPQMRAATDPSASGGQLYTPRWANNGVPVRRPLFARSKNPRSIATLFEVSASETGLTLDVAAAMQESTV